MRKSSLNIVTLGCSKNKVDSEHLAALLEHKYLIRHDSDKKSDVVIINTCGFIGDAQEESIDTILEYAELRKQGKIKKLYVTGCLSQRFKRDLQAEIHEVDAFYGVESVNLIAALIRGGHVSVPMDNLIEEAKGLAKQGVKELILIAQDLTYYGHDIDGQSHIVELVKALADIDGFEWIRLHYGYPLGFPDELLDLMRENPKICHYIDLPLQHISTHILQAMRRGVDREQTIGFVENVRKHVPDIAFRTTFIVGFPGETEEDFEELCQFIKDMRFERAGVFAFSPEEGTAAYEMQDDVPDEVKQERVDKLMDIQQNISLEINGQRVGKTEKVLIDRLEGDYYIGRTQYDSPEVDDEILISAEKELQIGHFYQVKITQADYFDCYAEVVN